MDNCCVIGFIVQARRKEPKPKLFGPDILRRGKGLRHEEVGAKKFGMSLETREIKLFGKLWFQKLYVNFPLPSLGALAEMGHSIETKSPIYVLPCFQSCCRNVLEHLKSKVCCCAAYEAEGRKNGLFLRILG